MKMTSAITPTRTPNKLQAKDEGLFDGIRGHESPNSCNDTDKEKDRRYEDTQQPPKIKEKVRQSVGKLLIFDVIA